jgi:hypothetical protein
MKKKLYLISICLILSNNILAQSSYYWRTVTFNGPVKQVVIRSYANLKDNPADSLLRSKDIIYFDTLGCIQSIVSYNSSDTLGLKKYEKSVPVYVSVYNQNKKINRISMIMGYRFSSGQENYDGVNILQYKSIEDTMRVEKEYKYSNMGVLKSYAFYHYEKDTIWCRNYTQNGQSENLDTTNSTVTKVVNNKDGTVQSSWSDTELYSLNTKEILRKMDNHNNIILSKSKIFGKWDDQDYECDITTTIEITYCDQ